MKKSTQEEAINAISIDKWHSRFGHLNPQQIKAQNMTIASAKFAN